MTKAGGRILAGPREALAYARGEDVPGIIVHPESTGGRDWKAEAAAIEREYREAKAAVDEAFEAVRPGSPTRIIATRDLLTFGAMKERFEAAKARRKVFIQERIAHEAASMKREMVFALDLLLKIEGGKTLFETGLAATKETMRNDVSISCRASSSETVGGLPPN